MDSEIYNDARALDNIGADLVFSDFKRGINRARILALANGEPSMTEEEAASARAKTNINDLTHPALLHEARTQFANGFFQAGQFMTCRTDWAMGQPHMTDVWSSIVEKEINKVMVESIEYYEALRSKFGLLVLNGIGPAAWRDSYSFFPEPLAVSDLLVPVNTKVGFSNLPILCLRKSFTAMELIKLTSAAKRDPGWNMPFVNSCLDWIKSQMKNGLQNQNWQYYRPEKWQEEIKQDAGWFLNDMAPTLDVFDFYCYVGPDNGEEGWVRRIILDSWSNPGNPPNSPPQRLNRAGGNERIDKTREDSFLFNSGDQVMASRWQNIVSVQYADLSASFPAMHNSVRSLGWLAYSLCHLQSRAKGRIYDSLYESLLQYFRVKNRQDLMRALKVELGNYGFVDETIQFIPQQERWQPPSQFIELGMGFLKGDLDSHTKSWTATPDAANARTEKTKFQYMAEIQRVTGLTSAAITQAHRYQREEYREMFRRGLMAGSKDPHARAIRENCLRQGVPEKLLNSIEAWEVDSERMTGQGNQTLELMTAEAILKMAQVMAPDKQQIAYRDYVLALTHNPQKALEYFPMQKQANNPASEQARNDFATCLQGVPVPPVPSDKNQMQYTVEFLKNLLQRVQAREKGGGMVKPEELQGLGLAAQTVQANLKVLGKNKANQKVVKALAQKLGEAVNLIKAFGQRLREAAKKQAAAQQKQNGDGGKTASAIIGAVTKAKIKSAEARQKLSQKNQAFRQEMAHKAIRTRADIAEQDLRAASDIHRGMFDSAPEDEDEAGG